jgi:polyisoprenoid-binding protein YceI
MFGALGETTVNTRSVRVRMSTKGFLGAVIVFSALGAGCGNSNKNVGATATALESAKPASAASLTFSIDEGTSKATWEMDAPLEKIYGEIPGLKGDLFIDPADITKTTGRIDADVTKLDLFQQKRKNPDDEKSEFVEKSHNATQNEHARQWLEIDPKTDEAKRKVNEVSQFSISKVETSTPDVSKMTGNERKVSGMLSGQLLLHGHKADYSAKFDATFTYEGDKPKKVVVKTSEPIKVNLGQFEVQPHDAGGKTLAALSGKVAESAPVMIEFTANIK